MPSTGRGAAGRTTIGRSSTPTMGRPTHGVLQGDHWVRPADCPSICNCLSIQHCPSIHSQIRCPVITESGPWQERRVEPKAETLCIGRTPGASSLGAKSASSCWLLPLIQGPWLPSPAPTKASGSWGYAASNRSWPPGGNTKGQ